MFFILFYLIYNLTDHLFYIIEAVLMTTALTHNVCSDSSNYSLK